LHHPNEEVVIPIVNEPSLNEPAKVSKTIFIKPAKKVKKQAKIVKEHTKVAKKPA
jgi:hypothetical protein